MNEHTHAHSRDGQINIHRITLHISSSLETGETVSQNLLHINKIHLLPKYSGLKIKEGNAFNTFVRALCNVNNLDEFLQKSDF